MISETPPAYLNYSKWGLINYRPEEIKKIASYLVLPQKVKRFLKSLYNTDPMYPAEAIFKFLLLFEISTFKHLTSFYRWATAVENRQFLIELGFRQSYDVWVPSYKTFWHFENIRIGKEKIHKLFEIALTATFPIIKRAYMLIYHDAEVGTRALMDATPITATSHDGDASYNGHYKVSCYLWHRLICPDTGIPLDFEVTTGSIHEGHIGPALVLRARALNRVPLKELWFDMKYAFGEALATYWFMGIETHYRISASWAVSPEYKWPSLLRRYYRLWHEEDYKPNAGYDEVLRFLVIHGSHYEVGLHLRNLRVSEYLDAPDSYIETVTLRSGIEASNGYAKRISGINGREFHGISHVVVHVGFYELGRLVIAYSRAIRLLRARK